MTAGVVEEEVLEGQVAEDVVGPAEEEIEEGGKS